MTTTAPAPVPSTSELTFTPVEGIPEATRNVEGRVAIAWEDKLAPLKSKAGQAFVTWTYEKKSAATSRVAAIRNRLFSATPEDNWTLAVRAVPGSSPEVFGVYVQYNGTYTADEVAANAKDRAERSAKIKAAREAAQAASGAVGEEASVATPAEKVAAARKAAAPTGK
jgi:hypothetical protein